MPLGCACAPGPSSEFSLLSVRSVTIAVLASGAYVLAGLGELLDLSKGFLFVVLKLSALAVDFAGRSIDHPTILLQLLCTQEKRGV